MKSKKTFIGIITLVIIISIVGFFVYKNNDKNDKITEEKKVEKELKQLENLTKEVDNLLIDTNTYMKAYENVNKILKDTDKCKHYWDFVEGAYNEKTLASDLKCRNCKEKVTVNRAELEIWVDYRDDGENGQLYQSIGQEITENEPEGETSSN